MSMSQVGSGLPRLLAERYGLSEQVASGGMTSVWRGHDRVLGRDVVVKVLHLELAADPSFRARFHEEAVNAARLTHPNIVALYDTGEQGDVAYIVMELVNGPTLREALGRHGPLPPSRAARLSMEVAAALDYAHQAGVCHGSLRPGNILLADDGTVKVADFSIARAATGEDSARTGEVLDADGSLAPEVVHGDDADGRADVFGLGACLYEMLTGRPPGADPSTTIPPRALRAGVPRDLDTIVRQAMAPDPDDRFQTVQAMAAAPSWSAAGADSVPSSEFLLPPPRPRPAPMAHPLPRLPAPRGPAPRLGPRPRRRGRRPGRGRPHPGQGRPQRPVRRGPPGEDPRRRQTTSAARHPHPGGRRDLLRPRTATAGRARRGQAQGAAIDTDRSASGKTEGYTRTSAPGRPQAGRRPRTQPGRAPGGAASSRCP